MSARIRAPRLDPPYDSILAGVLRFTSLAETEITLTRLENLRQRFLASGDKKGVGYCRLIALAGRQRAEMIARSPRVSAGKRRQKEETALWFRIWLENPDLFGTWLVLRKNSDECRTLLATERGSNPGSRRA